jgi:hypothetical protein
MTAPFQQLIIDLEGIRLAEMNSVTTYFNNAKDSLAQIQNDYEASSIQTFANINSAFSTFSGNVNSLVAVLRGNVSSYGSQFFDSINAAVSAFHDAVINLQALYFSHAIDLPAFTAGVLSALDTWRNSVDSASQNVFSQNSNAVSAEVSGVLSEQASFKASVKTQVDNLGNARNIFNSSFKSIMDALEDNIKNAEQSMRDDIIARYKQFTG